MVYSDIKPKETSGCRESEQLSNHDIYEMVILARDYQMKTFSVNDYREQLERDGRMVGPWYRTSIGYYPSRLHAEQAFGKVVEKAFEEESSIDFVFIRQKAMGLQKEPHAYIKEWSYNGDLLVQDESLVRNYDVDTIGFYGRPPEMIRHKVGDIVNVVDDYGYHWGIVCELPMTPDEAARLNERASRRSTKIVGESIFDYSDDQYVILTNDREYMSSHEHILSHHIFPPVITPPDFVRRILEQGLHMAKN